MTSALDELIARLGAMPDSERKAIAAEAMKATKDFVWIPNPGPQTEAYFSLADELFYGGQAGGGKSALAVGLAATAHERSLILRRINKDAKNLAEAELLGKILDGDRSGWNGTDLAYRDGKKLIKFGGCELEEDKQRYKGDPHDLICLDEVTDFLESQYLFITTWNRSTTQGQRCRVVCTGNPPTSATGLWVIRRWAAWLDPAHPNPAKPGELRWYIRDENDSDVEVDGIGPHMIGGREVYATSRTFIPAGLNDNPDLAEDGNYARILDRLPKELRDAYRDGKFDASLKDDPKQAIPTAWVQAAMARWTKDPPKGIPMCAMGVDVAQGGSDNNTISRRHDGWFDELIVVPGSETPLGTDIAGEVIKRRRDRAAIILDCGGGYGGSAFKSLQDNGVDVIAYKGGTESRGRTEPDRQLEFSNKRTEAYWRFREALDPDQPGGSRIALPPDQTLLADLTAPRYSVERNVIRLEKKEDLVKRIGRSPDRGDAVVMAWAGGNKMENSYQSWSPAMQGRKQVPQVIMTNRRTRR